MVYIYIVPQFFLKKTLRYFYLPTTGVADLQAPLNNMLQSSLELLMRNNNISQPNVFVGTEFLAIK